ARQRWPVPCGGSRTPPPGPSRPRPRAPRASCRNASTGRRPGQIPPRPAARSPCRRCCWPASWPCPPPCRGQGRKRRSPPTRARLNQRRHLLTQAAARPYPGAARVGTTALLCRPEWIPARPLGLDEVTLTWAEHPPAAAVTGAEPESEPVRPLRADGSRYPGYADTIAALDPPPLF